MRRTDPLARAIVEAAVELHRRRLWQETPGDAPFLIRPPDEPTPMVASILGHMGSEYGLSLARGEHALALTVLLHRSERDPPEEVDTISLLGVTMESMSALPPDACDLLKDAGFQVGHDGVAPLFMAKPPHRAPRPPNRSELRLILTALRAVLAVHSAGQLRLRRLDLCKRRIFQIVAAEEDGRVTARGSVVPWPRLSLPPPGEPIGTLHGIGASLPRRDEKWLVAWQMHPVALEDDGRATAIFLVVEDRPSAAPESQGLAGGPSIFAVDVIPAGDFEQAAEALARVLRGEARGVQAGLPREIAFASTDLYAALREVLTGLGIAVTTAEDQSLVEYTLGKFESALLDIGRAMRGQREAAVLPTTLDQWKSADRRFLDEIVDDVLGGPPQERPLARYFGSRDAANEIMEELKRLQPVPGFLEWYFADYRATKRSPTYLERWLTCPKTTTVEAALIEARRNARLSIFRVDSTQPGATFEVEDILTGERATVHDRAFSGCDIEGVYVPLRIVRLGEWDTCVVAGPALSQFQVDAALRYLEALGAELTPEGLRRSAHLMGRLWKRILNREREPNRPLLCNTDGEPLEPLTAIFRVANSTAIEATLKDRADLDYDESADLWVWSRPGGPAPGFGKTTVLARLKLLGDQLLVDVNSKGRLARARSWLESLPGVSFERATVHEMGKANQPLDDRLGDPKPPEPPSPELRAQLQAMQLESCRRWLDTRVPALGNLTPREACATEQGRRRVAVLIRTMPAMGIPGGSIAPPREELLRELGLERRGATRSAAAGA